MTEPNRTKNRENSLFLLFMIFIGTLILSSVFAEKCNILALSAAGACSAWLIFQHSLPLGIIGAIPSAIISYFLTGSFYLASLSLAFIPLGICFAFVSKKRLSRTLAAAISGAVISASAIILICIYTSNIVGSLGIPQFRLSFNKFFDVLSEIIIESSEAVVAGKEIHLINAGNIDSYLNSIIAIMPGCLVFLGMLTSFLTGVMYRLLLKFTNKPLPEQSFWNLSPSPITAILLLVSLIVSLLSIDSDIILYAAVNISLMISPMLLVSGLNSFTEIKIVNGIPRLPFIRIIIAFGTILIGGVLAFLIYALICGVFDSILTLLRKKDGGESA